jgi:hypothetical protein
MENLSGTVQEDENNKIADHLYAIEAIAIQKSIGSGLDKIIGELILHGVGQFHLHDGFKGIEAIGYQKTEQQYLPRKITRTEDVIHKENRDLVRHMLNIRNLVNTKCSRCSNNCHGCGFSGREYFNIESGMRIIFLYDWKAILEVVKLEQKAYYDEVYNFVNHLQDKVGGGPIIDFIEPDFETNYRPH